MIDTVILSIVAAMIYAGSAYLKKNLNENNPESFDAVKFLTTVVIAAGIGVVASSLGVVITEEYVALQLATYGGLTAILENLFKSAYRYAVSKEWL